MKLRNKKTGEIIDCLISAYGVSGDVAVSVMDANQESGYLDIGCYHNLAELNEDWEDVPEEPEEYWYIGWDGEVWCSDIYDERTEQMKLIGNYFETRKEAEKAVERLRAWQRLKEAGLVTNWGSVFSGPTAAESGDHFDCCGKFYINGTLCHQNKDKNEQYRRDLTLIFGDEE